VNSSFKIAVLLATHNGGAFIFKQCDSFSKQIGVDVSLVISDDSSTDNTLEIISTSLSAPPITLSQTRQASAAQNFFRLFRDSDFSNAQYVALSDQDDIWQQDKLSHAVRKIQENNVDAYSSNVTAFWPNGKQRLINKAQPQKQFDYMFESAGPGCTFVMTKKLALAVQKFLIENQQGCTQVALHDWFIYAFARSRGYKWFIDPTSHMLYRQHSANVVGANVGVKAKLARWKKLREGWLIKQALLIAEILGYTEAWPIKKLKRYCFLDRLILILNIKKLRRRLRDRIALALFLILPLRK
jgi:rhamnosyltransferase